MLSTILWDIDGTLLNFQKAERWSIVKCFSDIGFTKCDDAFLERYSKLNRRYWDMLEHGEISIDRLLTERFTEFFLRSIYLFKTPQRLTMHIKPALEKLLFQTTILSRLLKS